MEALLGPYGFSLALTCICVVFAVLFVLYLCYDIIGRIFVTRERKGKEIIAPESEDMPSDTSVHDSESGIITINRSERPYGELPKKVIIPLHVKLGQAVAPHSDESDVAAAAGSAYVHSSGTVLSPLPGVIVNISVKIGDHVTAGQRLAVLEAMKMENSIEAEKSGKVEAIYVQVGDSVLEGAKIVKVS